MRIVIAALIAILSFNIIAQSSNSDANSYRENGMTLTPNPQHSEVITVENAQRLAEINRLSLTNPIRSIAWFPTNERLITATTVDGELTGDVREYDTSNLHTNPLLISTIGARLVEISPNGSIVAIGRGRKVTFLSPDEYTIKARIHLTQQIPYVFNDFSFSPNGSLVATSDSSLYIRIWDVATGLEQYSLSTHDELGMLGGGAIIYAVSFIDDESIVFTDSIGDSRPLLYRWNFTQSASPVPFESVADTSGSNTTTSLVLNPDHNMIAAGGWDGRILLWNVESLTMIKALEGHESWITDMAFSPQGTLLVSSGIDDTVRLWNVDTGELLHAVSFGNDPILSLAFNQAGTVLALGSLNGNLLLWSVATA